jgi:hypothetical protein
MLNLKVNPSYQNPYMFAREDEYRGIFSQTERGGGRKGVGRGRG